MKVAAIIPTYNRREYLGESLKSIALQTRPADFVVVVDDGSNPAVVDLVDDYRRQYFQDMAWPAFRCIRNQTNKGKSESVNEAIHDLTIDGGEQHAFEGGPDLFWIFDDDDIADPRRLEICVPYFEENPALDLIHTSAEWRQNLKADEDGKIVGALGQRRYWKADDCAPEHRLRWFLNGCRWFGISVLFHKRALDKLAILEPGSGPGLDDDFAAWPFDPKLERAQDYDLWIRLIHAGAVVEAVDRVTVYARDHAGARGFLHRLKTGQDVDAATLRSEREIMRKIKKIPFGDIFPGRSTEADNQGNVELAYALFLRDMVGDAIDYLKAVDKPELIQDIHVEACDQIIEKLGTIKKIKPLEAVAQARRIRAAWILAHPDQRSDPGIAAASAAANIL